MDGDAWLTLINGTYSHDGYVPQSIAMTVTPMARPVPEAISAELDIETFEAYVGEMGNYTLTYTDSWSEDPEDYGVTITNDPVSGDSILIEWDGVNDPVMSVYAVPRVAPPAITATIDEETFVSYVGQSGTIVLTYSMAWSADPTLYGITVSNEPIAGDSITVVYVKEVRGTIIQSNPQTFVSTSWNLYNHELGYARAIKYSPDYNFKISGTYTLLEFSQTVDGSRITITPVSGAFSIPYDGYLFVTGGNATDTAIWMTWSDWANGYNWTGSEEGDFAPYSESVIDISSFMATNFPYGLMAVKTIRDEINLNIGIATSRVFRQPYNAINLAAAKASGRAYEYDEDYIYIERETPITYDILVDGDYFAYDHGLEYFTGTDQDVYAQTLYGQNLKNKLERDTLTISQQTLNDAQKTQVRTNISAASQSDITELNNNLASLNNKFSVFSGNLNDLKTSGLYYSAGASGGPGGWGYVCVIANGAGSEVKQVFYANSSDDEYTRYYRNGAWSAWNGKLTYNSGSIDIKTTILAGRLGWSKGKILFTIPLDKPIHSLKSLTIIGNQFTVYAGNEVKVCALTREAEYVRGSFLIVRCNITPASSWSSTEDIIANIEFSDTSYITLEFQ